jgi:hypothetical protein
LTAAVKASTDAGGTAFCSAAVAGEEGRRRRKKSANTDRYCDIKDSL